MSETLKRVGQRIGKVLFIILLCFAIIIIICDLFFSRIKVPTDSMSPLIPEGAKVLVQKNVKSINRGDVLVFYSEEFDTDFVKRVIGLPGDRVTIEEGRVSINGIKLDESYVSSPSVYTGEFVVPVGYYFFLGDNREDSYDARYWANPFISESCIKGKAIYLILPEFRRIEGADYEVK